VFQRLTHSTRLFVLVVALAFVACGPPPTPEVKPDEAVVTPTPEATPRGPMSGRADQGVYRFYLNEEPLVTTEFTWKDDGTYSEEYVLTIAGQTVRTSLAIAPSADGGWQSMTMETKAGPVSVTRKAARRPSRPTRRSPPSSCPPASCSSRASAPR